MFSHLSNIVRRDNNEGIPHTMIALLVVLLVLLIITLLLVAALLFMRQRRRRRTANMLSTYDDGDDEKRLSTSSTSSHHRRVMVRPSESVYVYQEKQKFMDESQPPSPTSSIPEIRITFPEEFDSSGNRQSGRVVVVRVGDTSVGLEPVAGDEKLPNYGDDERFQSLDLDRIGGLVERAHNNPATWKEVQ